MTTPADDCKHHPVQVVVISGLSGSGKSTAIRALEDIGFFCIDNLPVVLLPKLIELFPGTPGAIEQIALVVDARETRFLDKFERHIDRIREKGNRVEVVFLECSDKVLLRRYSETRRRHPLAPDGSVDEGILRERTILEPLRSVADQVIDTSEFNPHQLRRLLQEHFTHIQPGREMNLALLSFGFKNGIPAQSDLVFDVRFLPNPYFVEELKEENGLNPKVAGYVLASPDAARFLDHVASYLTTFRPLYNKEGKSYLTVGVGCTGGKHRSVAIVEELAKRLQEAGEPLTIRHRDMSRA